MSCATPVLPSGSFGHVPETAGHVAEIAGHDPETAGHLRPKYAAGTLLSVLDDVSTELIDVHAVWPKVAHLRPKVRHVVDTLVALAEDGRLD